MRTNASVQVRTSVAVRILLTGVFVCGGSTVAAPTFAEQGLPQSEVMRVRVAEVSETVLVEDRTSTCIVLAYRKATVATEVGGRIVERSVEPGHLAAKGEVLARTDDRRARIRLLQADALAKARRAEAERALQELDRLEPLLQQQAISQDMLDDRRFAQQSAAAELEAALANAEDARREVEDTLIRAPFSGKVEVMHVQLGDYANMGQPAATLSDFSQARLICGVSSSEVGLIQVGETARATFADLGGVQLQARVTSVGSIKNERVGTFPVELLLEGAAAENLREGLVGVVAWRSATANSAVLTIPSGAVVRRGGGHATYVVVDGVANETPIRTGRGDGRRVEVFAGVTAGDLVVIEGQFALRDGARVETTGPGL